MLQLNTYDIIVHSALKYIEIQRPDGSFPKGHNGPWHDEDTYVRTTAHWAIKLFKAYEITGEPNFLDSAVRACDYLLSKEARPHKKAFYCRTNSTNKNRCNGLIGQAWAIEPLLILGKALNNESYLSTAEEVLSLHPYCFKRHGWLNVDIDGQVLYFNRTFNQQVWFSVMAILAGQRNQELLTKAQDFFENIPNVIEFVEKSLIKHTYYPTDNKSINNFIKDRVSSIINRKKSAITKKLSLGYLSFILYGLAIVRDNLPNENLWRSTRLKSIIRNSVDYIIRQHPFGYLDNNEFQWGYNPTGIEIAYTLQVFNSYLDIEDNDGDPSKWLNMQFNGYYDLRANLMLRNSSDENISVARLYEATRLKNYRINFHDLQENYINN